MASTALCSPPLTCGAGGRSGREVAAAVAVARREVMVEGEEGRGVGG